MAGLIPQSFIDDVLDRVDIVDVISSRVKLKKAGKSHLGLCPFHNEKTPSFNVVQSKQFYHCFGCGASGNALKFLLEHDRMHFPEAVEELARMAGMEVPREHNPEADRKRQQQKTLYGVLEHAADFYRRQLREHAGGDNAVRYLKDRGLSGQVAQQFGIGFAPPGWDNLLRNQQADNDRAQLQRLVDSGMVIAKEDGKTYDRFRDRIMFPIRDIRGRVIAFGGRVMGDDKPKYLNSPETTIFHKSRELYGLYEALQAQRQPERFLVVEGYMDVIALHQFGLPYGVATLGTATSADHLDKLFRLANEVIFCFDGDDAGRKAAVRALDTALSEAGDGRTLRFLFLPQGEDPDTLIRQEGLEAFEERLSRAPTLSEFLLQHWQEQVDMETMDGRARLVHIAVPQLKQLPPQGMLVSLIMQRLADLAGLPPELIRQRLAEAPDPKTTQRPATPPVAQEAAPVPPPPDLMEHADPGPPPDWLQDGPPVLDTLNENQRLPSSRDLNQTRQPPPWQKAMALMLCWPQLAEDIDLGERQFKDGDHIAWVKSMLTLLQSRAAANRYEAMDLLAPHGFEDLLRGLSRTEYFAILTRQNSPGKHHKDILRALLRDLTHEPTEREEYEQLRQLWLTDRKNMTGVQKERYLTLLKKSKLSPTFE
ncbi:DNA primase [Natronospirillum operosum]|uniref:DNA primase n=1 Tax=Natronospirillum operosum TaxID=2759953 RepID=A0A4Z0W5X6_9GAMM|nr:DNA primase [Natronospirillum operosum]TGG92490.1 DNA primase [Natronospirillum operosum]